MTANRLQAMLDRAVSHPEPAKIKTSKKPQPKMASPGRQPGQSRSPESGTVLVGAHLPPAYNRQLRMLAAEEGVTSNTLIREALDLLFVKKGRDRIRR